MIASKIPRPSKTLLNKKQTIPFLYMWTELSTGKWYIGSRTAKGCHPNDSYICSSRTVYKLITDNPSDWVRDILFIGTDVQDVRTKESFMLTFLGAQNNKMSYNKTNKYAQGFDNTGKITVTDGMVQTMIDPTELDAYIEKGWHRGVSDAAKKKLSVFHTEYRKTNPVPVTLGKSNNKSKHWVVISPTFEVFEFYGGMDKFCEKHNLSPNTVSLAVRQGWIPNKGTCLNWRFYNLTDNTGTFRKTENVGDARSGVNNPGYKHGKFVGINKKS